MFALYGVYCGYKFAKSYISAECEKTTPTTRVAIKLAGTIVGTLIGMAFDAFIISVIVNIIK